jgi:hypothetical protein
LMSAINPTPQESFSSAGSNKPKPAALIVALATPHRSPVRSEPRRRPPSAGPHACAEGRINPSRRQPSCRFAAAGCLSSPSDAPCPLTADHADASGFFRHRGEGGGAPDARGRSLIGTAMLSYAEDGKFQAQTQGHAGHTEVGVGLCGPGRFRHSSVAEVDHGHG